MTEIKNVGIIVALKEEFEVLIKTLNVKVEAEQYEDVAFITYKTQYETKNKTKLQIIFLVMNGQGNVTSADATQWFIGKYNFYIIINIGIAGLLSKDHHLFDVIIGEEIYQYDYRTKVVDNVEKENFDIKKAGRCFSATKQLANVLSQLKTVYPDIYQSWMQASNNERANNLNTDTLNKLKSGGLLVDIQVIEKGVLVSGEKVGASSQFKENLTAQNRLVSAIDMESVGVLQSISSIKKQQPLSLIIKAISDPADGRKKHLDEIKDGVLRKIAMTNASNVLRIFLNMYNFDTEVFENTGFEMCEKLDIKKDILYEETLAILNNPFKMNFSDVALKLWGRIFFLIGNQQNLTLREEHFWDDVFAFINMSDNDTPLNIIGDPGSGISPCLSALYYIFHKKYFDGETEYYPIHIDFRKIRTKIYKDDRDLLSQATAYAKEEIRKILSYLNTYDIKNILLIYDGVDYTSKFQKPLENTMSEMFSSFSNKKIIGIRKHFIRKRVQNRGAVITFQLIRLESEKFDKLVNIYSEIENKPIDLNQLKFILKKCHFNEIDIFLLRLIFNKKEETLNNGDVLFLFEEFCLDHLDKTISENTSGNIMNEIAEFAFSYEIEKRTFSEEDLYHNPAWQLFNRNKEIQYFLIAKHIINSLVLIANGNKNINFNLNIIHTSRVNSYCRYLINIDVSTQEAVLNVAEKKLKLKKKFRVHASVLYLLGRLTDGVIKEKARILIRDYLRSHDINRIKNKTKIPSENEKELLLALRTCYISLASLGDNSASEEYITILLSNPIWCSINRGFHLVYYGDQPYDFNVGFIASDDETKDCSKTYLHLYNRICTFNKEPLTDTEIYTFFSLIQHRHKDGKFNDMTKLNEVANLINKILEKNVVEYSELKSYLKLLKETFSKSTFSHFALLRQINNIKFEKRKGWVHRNFKNEIEVVASHTLNAVYMASLLLPDNGYKKDLGYNKPTILNILLYHDLAECVIHDHLPWEKKADVNNKENDFYERLSLYGTYGFFNTIKIYDLWKEFEKRDSINSKIAKEIDKLEAYAQLLSYLELGEKIEKEDFKKWRKEIDDITQTEYGKKIKKYIEFEFKSTIENNSN